MNMTTAIALNEYRSSGAHGGVEQADAHGLVNLLFNKAIDNLTSAKGYIERNQIQEKAVTITKTIAILDGLRSSLDLDNGGSIAQNLDDLYDYMQRRLVVANADNDENILREIADLLSEIHEAWNSIPKEARI